MDHSTPWQPDQTSVAWGRLWERLDAHEARLDQLAQGLEHLRRLLIWLVATTLVGPSLAVVVSAALHTH